MRFVDQAIITVSSGKGGRGSVSFRREKFIPRGGPDGGDGGRGGDVVFEATTRLQTLYDFTHRRIFRAKNGASGAGVNKTGADAPDLVIAVPLGTMIHDSGSDELLADLTRPGQRFVAARGGRGGKGNKHFTTSTNRAPRYAQPGEPGDEKKLRLELKLIADVALVGLPNAGKSTLISFISAARPKVADYPFTTINPNLGVVTPPGREPFVVADVPGLIEGASRGLGLGHRFLRHVQRTRLLVFLLDASRDAAADLDVLRRELAAYSPELARREHLVVLSKADLPEADLAPAGLAPDLIVSALTGLGLEELVTVLADRLEALAAHGEKDEATPDDGV